LAGKQQWGLAMQNDITDGTKWLVQQKLADSARIAIVGTSGYGGYAALMGAIKEPTLYRCAAAFSPITDLELLRDTREHYLFNDDNMPGSDTDVALLKTYSPAYNADKIGVPILLVHGRKDFTVPVDHTEEMSKSLSLAGKAFEVLYLKEADHNFGNADDRIAMLTALEKFLSTHLAGQSEQINPAGAHL
jgi:dipeptidyl aminopeptidase/acylaminoacyl peptidase